jgi:phosphatidate cytidylyltransferase
MIITIYLIILSYFLLGFIGFFFINKKTDKSIARENWIKYITYFLIIHILFFCIAFYPDAFFYLGLIIFLVGMGEVLVLFFPSGYYRKSLFLMSLFVYMTLGILFLRFTTLDQNLILYSFLIISIFDAFSQISGQLFGRRKILPSISPAKTLEGFMGGVMFALAGSMILKHLIDVGLAETLALASGIVICAFSGDMAASYIKRQFHVKDFSKLIPGHGGFLDRFDSLIGGGAFISLAELIKLFGL